MKKTFIIVASLTFISGGVFSQVAKKTARQIDNSVRVYNADELKNKVATEDSEAVNLKTPKNDGTAKVGGTVLWHETFGDGATKSKVVGADGTTPVAGYENFTWTKDNDGESTADDTKYGWSIHNGNGNGWWGAGGAFNPPGNYAEVSNGDPRGGVAATEAQKVKKKYVLTSGAIDLETLSPSNKKLNLVFSQCGSMFNDHMDIIISADDGGSWDTIRRNRDFYKVQQQFGFFATPEVITVDIEPYITGKVVTNFKIRFAWNSTNPESSTPALFILLGWFIDDVKIEAKGDVDIATTYNVHGFDHFTYSQIPKKQADKMKMAVRSGVRNAGVNTLNNIKLELTNGITYTSDAIANLVAMATDTFNITNNVGPGASSTDLRLALPGAVGDYSIKRTLVMDETGDVDPANSTIPDIKLSITDNIYAADWGAPYDDRFSFNGLINAQGQPIKMGEVAVLYKIYEPQTLYGVDVVYYVNANAPSSTQKREFADIVVKVYEDPEGEQEILKGTSSPYFIPVGKAVGGVHTIAFDTPVELEASKRYIVSVAPVYPDSFSIAVSGEIIDNKAQQNVQTFAELDLDWQQVLYLDVTEDDNHAWKIRPSEIPVIRMNFNPNVPPVPKYCELSNVQAAMCLASTREISVNDSTALGTWDVSDPNVLDISTDGNKATITAKGNGNAVLSYKPHATNKGCYEEAKRTIVVSTDSPPCAEVGINDMEAITEVAIFPNPTSNKTNVEFTLQNNGTVTIEVTDLTGKVVSSKTIKNASAGTNNVDINTSDYARGVYSVSIKTADSVSTHKLIKN